MFYLLSFFFLFFPPVFIVIFDIGDFSTLRMQVCILIIIRYNVF